MEAIVLAGGKGTRLKSVVADLPKPMASIGKKPFLEYVFKYLKVQGVKNIVVSVGYKWEIIESYFGTEYDGVKLVYSVESEPLGTGGAIKRALQKIKGKELYVMNGDTFFNVNLSKLNLTEDCKIALSLKQMKNFDRYGCIESHNGIVTKFVEKEYRRIGNINGGVYLIKKDIFDPYDVDEKFSFEDFVQDRFLELNASASIFSGYFIDIGIPKDYRKAQDEIESFL